MTRTSLRRIAAGTAFLSAALLLAGCGGPAPAPDGTTTPAAVDGGSEASTPSPPDHGWLVTASTSYLQATNRICSWQPRLMPDPTGPFAESFGGIFGTSRDGGLPDDWTPDQMQVVDPDGISFDLLDGTWRARRERDTDDSWISNGTFTFDVGDDGYVTGGSGTGDTDHDTANGDRIPSSETVTFTVDEIPDPPWCAALLESNLG